MHHFLFEFITGGGLSTQALPKTLINEGEMMVQTLLNELIIADQRNISLCRDKRLRLIDVSRGQTVQQHIIDKQPIDKILPNLLKEVDVLWLIAPETGLCLFSLATLFARSGKHFIGSNPQSIKISSSKLWTYQALSAANIQTPKTHLLSEAIPPSDTGWVIKPDDGVGSTECYLIQNNHALSKFQIAKTGHNNMIIQPYIKGKIMSMSLLVLGSDVCLLACNKQYIEIKEDRIGLVAIGINECLSYRTEMLQLAQKIIHAIAGFAGYIGIDIVEYDGQLYVLDINPRLTTAYAGLSESLTCNVSMAIFNTVVKQRLPTINLALAKPVKVYL